MIAGKTWREIRLMALVYLLILELLAIPVLLLWPDLYSDLQKSTLFRNLPIDFVKRITEGVSDTNEQIAYRNWVAVMLYFRSVNLAGIAASVLMGVAVPLLLLFGLAEPFRFWCDSGTAELPAKVGEVRSALEGWMCEPERAVDRKQTLDENQQAVLEALLLAPRHRVDGRRGRALALPHSAGAPTAHARARPRRGSRRQAPRRSRT